MAELTCPNEPVGSRLLARTDFDAKTGNGFVDMYEAEGKQSLMSIATNQDGPASPPNALQATYPMGHPGGNGTGRIYFNDTADHTELFVCVMVKIDPNDFTNHRSAGNKIFYVLSASGNKHPYYFLMRNAGPPYSLWLVSQGPITLNNKHLGSICPWEGTCNLPPTGKGQIHLGKWTRIQLYLRQGKRERESVARWWVNDDLTGEYTNLNTRPEDSYRGVEINPVFGGAPDQSKPKEEYIWFDAMKISDPAEKQPEQPPPPAAVKIVDLLSDVDGASLTLEGKALKLRYWDDSTKNDRLEAPGFVAGAKSYRLIKRWPETITFLCVQPQTEFGEWIADNYRCVGVTPAKPEPPPPPPPVRVTVSEALQKAAGQCIAKKSCSAKDLSKFQVEELGKVNQ